MFGPRQDFPKLTTGKNNIWIGFSINGYTSKLSNDTPWFDQSPTQHMQAYPAQIEDELT